MQNSDKKIIIFDLDNTLVDGNTTFELAKLLCESKRLKYLLFRLQVRIYSSILGWSKKNIILNVLKNNDRKTIERHVHKLVSTGLEENSNILDLLKKFQAQHNYTVLLSGAIEEITLAYKHKFGFDYSISSRLRYKDDICTGRLCKDIQGKKHKEIISLRKESNNQSQVLMITDNYEDISCLEYVDILIGCGKTRKDEIYWKERNQRFFYVS